MKYEKRGVSADKTDVHRAIKQLDKGLYPDSFCKVLPDIICGDDRYALIMHADTAGTKTSLAYLYWRETGDLRVWDGISQDAIVMNLDDMAAAGVTDNIVLSSTIGRNKSLIGGDVITSLIGGTRRFLEKMQSLGVNIQLAGGETADVGDIVRTVDVGFTAFARLHRDEIVRIRIKPGDVIVGLESYGKASYEDEYNSGIGSNGLTFARHEMLHKDYAIRFPESFNPLLDGDVVYSGSKSLTDDSELSALNIGKMLLSPTRTYLPVIREILGNFRARIHGIIHNTGGGQTKILHFIDGIHVIKNNLIEIPPVFRMIQAESDSDWREMYKVFNMGQRLEIYVPENIASEIIETAKKYNIHAQITGYCEKSSGRKLTLHTAYGKFEYNG